MSPTTDSVSGDTAAAATAEEAAVQAVIEAYADRLRAGDAAGVVDLYSTDAVVMAPDIPTTIGAEALMDLYRDALDAVAMDFRFEFDALVVRRELAIARTRTSGRNTVRATGDDVPATHRELFVLRREPVGWKIGWYMFQAMPEP